ncbi:MAG: gamma-glutamyltransferase family protein [Pseudomonadota bacterium]
MRDLHLPGRSPVFAQDAMVATSHPLAVAVALDTLRSGGTAMDAALAGAVLLGLCEPQMTGIGGDLFALVAPAPDAPVVAFNGSGRAPAGADALALRTGGAGEMPISTAEAVTVPGAVDGMFQLAERFGQLGMEAVLAPAIHYAEHGVPVAPRVAFDWDQAIGTLASSPTPNARAIYLPSGQAPAVGQMHYNPKMAEALRLVAKEGRGAFYEGPIGEDIVATLRALGGTHTLDDLAMTRGEWAEPIMTTYGNYEVVEHPPNGQGATALLILNMLKHFELSKMDPFGANRAHIEAEITKSAYDARNQLIADPDHSAAVEEMLDAGTAARLAARVNPARASAPVVEAPGAPHRDTIYITVVDRDRMAVSLIYSIFHSFGSGIATDRYGILLHNRGAGFNLIPGHPNEYGPGKRPMHTIIPGMLRQKGAVIMPFGVMGGAYQATGHGRFVSNLEDYGLSPQESIDAPRSFAEGATLKMERGYPSKVHSALSEMGHQIEIPATPIGGAQAILMHKSGLLEGASDPRKDGCALGY